MSRPGCPGRRPCSAGPPWPGRPCEVGQGVELAGQLGEVVVELGQNPLPDRLDRDDALGVLAGVVAAGQRGGEGFRVAGRHTDQRLVQTGEHLVAADLVGHPGDRVDVLAGDRDADRSIETEVAIDDGAVDAGEGAEPAAQHGEPLVDVPSVTSTESTVTARPSRSGRGDLGPDVDLGGEGERLPSSTGTSVTSTSGWPRARSSCSWTAWEYSRRSASLTASLEHRAAADPLVDDPRRHVAPCGSRAPGSATR